MTFHFTLPLLVLIASVWPAWLCGQSIINDLRTVAVPLKSLNVVHADSSAYENMLPFLRGKSIIGVGEATHGAAEFYKLKHVLVDLMVRHLASRAVAFEISPAEAISYDRYIQGHSIDVDSLLNHGMWVWNTDEIRDMLNMLREWNSRYSETDKVHFYGFDVQSIEQAAAAILNYPVDEKMETSSDHRHTLQQLTTATFQSLNSVLDSTDIQKSSKHLSELAARWASQGVDSQLQYLLWSLTAALDVASSSNEDEAYRLRDYYMAENIVWIDSLVLGNGPLVLLTHNGHLSKAYTNPFDTTDSQYRPCGSYLSEYYGPSYYTIGTDFNAGSTLAMAPGAGIQPVSIGSMLLTTGAIAARVGLHKFFYDVEELSRLPYGGAFVQSDSFRSQSFGAMYDSSRLDYIFEYGPLNSRYDGVVFIDTITPANALFEPSGFAVVQIMDTIEAGKSYALVVESYTEASTSGNLSVFANIIGAPSSPPQMTTTSVNLPKPGRLQTDTLHFELNSPGLLNIGFSTEGKIAAGVSNIKLYNLTDHKWQSIPVPNSKFLKIDANDQPSDWYLYGHLGFAPKVVRRSGNSVLLVDTR